MPAETGPVLDRTSLQHKIISFQPGKSPEGTIVHTGLPMPLVSDDLIIFNLTVGSSTEAILALANLLVKQGRVNMQFGPSAVQRERSFPTGVPALPYAIAFPHAEPSTVYQSSLAIGSLAQPVAFRSMEDANQELPVRAVFLLANRSPREHVTMLKRLSLFFKKREHLERLLQINAKAELVNWLQEALFPSAASKND